MKPIFIEEIIKAVNGKIDKNINTQNIYVDNISTDTRNIKDGDLFIPIKGDNFDGHNFIQSAFEKGAKICLSEKFLETKGILIKVDNTKQALKDLAEYYRNIFDVTVVAITGSMGKTTTKDMIASVLSQKYNVVKTEGNFNNEIGLPLSVFKIEPETEVVVLEMGTNNFGEIRELSKIARPDIAIITNIGRVHTETLGSRDGVLRAKYEIFDYLNKDGLKILNGDDDILINLKDKNKLGKYISSHFYSFENREEAYATDITENGIESIFCKINYFEKKFEVKINHPAKYMVSSALVSTLVGERLELSAEQIKKGIECFKPSKMRMEIIKTSNYTIINDVYNANPDSMKSALDILEKDKGRKVAILGDMFELGEQSEKIHYEVGAYSAQKELNEIIFIGKLAYNMLKGAKDVIENKNKYITLNYFETQEEFFNSIESILKKGDIILLKASRGMQFEKTVDKIMR